MIFKDFNPLEDKTFRIIDNDGKVIDKARFVRQIMDHLADPVSLLME